MTISTVQQAITQNELKKVLKYDLYNGMFTWKVRAAKNVFKGVEAGNIASNGYINIGINKSVYLAHRLVWLYMIGELPKSDIDHINGIKTDNRWCNLRLATRSQNQFNRKVSINNKLGIKGVRKYKNSFRASARYNGVKYELGSYSSELDANKAYQNFCKKHHGEFYKEK